jgi:gliding motility-associated-like protein
MTAACFMRRERRYLYRTLGVVIWWFFGITAWSQISAPDASTFRLTEYTSGTTRVDTIYVVCSFQATGDGTTSRLAAYPPPGYPVVDVAWSKYNESAFNYDPPFLIESAVAASEASGLTSGGYRVRISDGGGLDTLFYAWLFVDEPSVTAGIQNYTCQYLALRGTAQADAFHYYDPGDQSQIELVNTVEFEWTSEPDSDIPYPTLELNPITYTPPYEDTWYYLTVSDNLECSEKDSVFYESIVVKADFEPQPAEGEAPLEVTFINNSENAVAYKWLFGDEESSIQETPDPHIYYVPGEYEVALGATSEAGCTDTLRYRYVTVDPSALDVPNVFTPNEDGINDYFFVAATSLRFLNIKILTRNGRKVYEFEGEGQALSEWQGWDGRIGGSKYASPGPYYYIIRAIGWDDVLYSERVYTGVVQLIREKQGP